MPDRPLVSVLMPTYRHAAFIARAVRSLFDQEWDAWELVVVDDGSPDETPEVLAPYLSDPRVAYERLARNVGLGAALNIATRRAMGSYIAYLPSDDTYDAGHLQALVSVLEADPDTYLAYAGVRWGPDRPGRGRMADATLQGDEAVGRERAFLENPSPDSLLNGNLFALVQVSHRRTLEAALPWRERHEIVTDRLEPDQWLRLLEAGAAFSYTGSVSCSWAHHPDQHHKIIASERKLPSAELGDAGGTGLAAYRRWYGVGRGEWLHWRPSFGYQSDERARYGRHAAQRTLPAEGGLRILLVGELGFNPERIMFFEERGHKLFGLWAPHVEAWDTIGPLPYGNVDDIPFRPGWEDAVQSARPDIIYGLLNWQALTAITSVLDARFGIPFVVHFKEGPSFAQDFGVWPLLRRALLESDGQLFINEENRQWYRWALGADFPDERTMIVDGDLPKADVATTAWAPKLSASLGGVHTVCAGRPYGLSTEPFEPLARADIHLHLYGLQFYGLRRLQSQWVRDGLASGHLHLHDAVEPQNWVSELSRYDAAWTHIFTSRNGGDLRLVDWDDINLPARLGTYAIAGLPWILRDNTGSIVAADRVAKAADIALFYDNLSHLRDMLGDRPLMSRLTANMVDVRASMTFDAHGDRIIDFFRRLTGS